MFAELELTHRRAKGEENLPNPPEYPVSNYPRSKLIKSRTLGAFPDLFPYGTSGHYPSDENVRVNAVSLEEISKWAMAHHSHRFALHPIFPYVEQPDSEVFVNKEAEQDPHPLSQLLILELTLTPELSPNAFTIRIRRITF